MEPQSNRRHEMNLGPLQELHAKLAGKEVLQRLVAHMAEIDGDITRSDYHPLLRGDDDRPPDGDDYNLLWDAVMDALLIEASDTQPEA